MHEQEPGDFIYIMHLPYKCQVHLVERYVSYQNSKNSYNAGKGRGKEREKKGGEGRKAKETN